MKIAVRILGPLCLAAAVMGAYNFFTLGATAEPAARAAACAGRGARCAPVMIRLERTAFFQDVQFRIARETITVRCARSAWLVGPLGCSVR